MALKRVPQCRFPTVQYAELTQYNQTPMIRTRNLFAATLLIPLVACGGGDYDATLVADSIAADMSASSGAAALRLTVAPEGNEARYRVREQLLGRDFPNDAVGVTSDIAGVLALDANGVLIAEESRIIVGVDALTSDQSRRDGYVRGRIMLADSFPSVELIPERVSGLPSPLSDALAQGGEYTFEVVGQLVLHNESFPTVWQVTARYIDGQVTGSASTAFTFDDVRLAKPQVRSVISVADTIKLEYDFTLISEQLAGSN